jgi:hypothetical protein
MGERGRHLHRLSLELALGEKCKLCRHEYDKNGLWIGTRAGTSQAFLYICAKREDKLWVAHLTCEGNFFGGVWGAWEMEAELVVGVVTIVINVLIGVSSLLLHKKVQLVGSDVGKAFDTLQSLAHNQV